MIILLWVGWYNLIFYLLIMVLFKKLIAKSLFSLILMDAENKKKIVWGIMKIEFGGKENPAETVAGQHHTTISLTSVNIFIIIFIFVFVFLRHWNNALPQQPPPLRSASNSHHTQILSHPHNYSNAPTCPFHLLFNRTMLVLFLSPLSSITHRSVRSCESPRSTATEP